jgi:biopolymer transport protein ExbB/TolQ
MNYVLDNMVSVVIIGSILFLAMIDFSSKNNFKSQIVSLGVLGTFIGIFIGLQNFDPEDMKNSINGILLGLKTAFLTSIVGMVVAIFLAIIEKFKRKSSTTTSEDKTILLAILKKLDVLDTLENSQNTDKIVEELERLRSIQINTRDETRKIPIAIDIFQQESHTQMNSLVEILDENFEKMNSSLEIAIDKLSKGATEEIIKALETVIKEFNQELQSSFGENFVALNNSVIKLVEWQENYKTHIETLDEKLDLSTTSIEKSKESLEIISSKNEDILKIYKALEGLIKKNQEQVNFLNEELETYAEIGEKAKEMLPTIAQTFDTTKYAYESLRKKIEAENTKQVEYNKEMLESIFEDIQENFNINKEKLDLISQHFKNLGIEIPKALDVSLTQLNRGLTSLTTQFQKDYQETLEQYNRGLDNGR